MDVKVGLVEELRREAEFGRVRANVADRRARRLLHDVAQLAGEDQVVMARRQQARLDEQDVAASLGPRDTGRDARPRHAERDFAMEPRRAEVVGQIGGVHGRPLSRRSGGDARRDLARDRANLPLQAPDARLARVVGHDPRAAPRRRS